MQKVFDYIERSRMIREGENVVVGVSGGADSLCLLFMLMEYRTKLPFSITAVHVEHGVRGEESLADAAYVKEVCDMYGIPLRSFSYDVPEIAQKRRISVEEAGREVRYEAFEKTACELGAAKIAVAHNQNDQAETMLFRMARGSGIAGMGGIRPVRGKIIRPLLCLNRSEIEAYLQKKGIAWRTDRTNEETDYTRNAIRHRILPEMEATLNPKTVEHMGALASDIRRVEAYLEAQAEKAWERTSVCEAACVKVDAAKFLREEELIQELVLRKCLVCAGCGLKDVTRVHLEWLMGLFTGQSGREIMLPGNYTARRVFDEVHIKKRERSYTSQKTAYSQRLQIPGEITCPWGAMEAEVLKYNKNNTMPFVKKFQKAYTQWLNYDKIKGDIYLRTRRPGDFLVINSSGGRKKLKEYFIEEKIPSEEREKIPVLASGSEILWVVGYRISEAYKVLEDTEKVLRVQMKEEK